MTGVALHDGQEAFACAGVRDVDVGCIEDSGHDVLDADGTFASDFFGVPPFFRGAYEKWNSGRRFIRPGFAKEIVVTQHFAVVRCEDGQAVVETAVLNEAADLVVYKVDHTVISRARTVQVVFVKANLPGIGIEPFLRTVKFGCPVSDDGIGQVPLDIAVVIESRRGKWGMGVDKGYVEKKRDCGIAFLEKVHCPVDTPEGVHLFFG